MSDEDQKFGLAGNEQAQGYEPMPMALPVEPTTALDVAEEMGTDHSAYQHLTRPDEGEPVDRSYKDVRSGEEIDPKFSVSQEQAASDLARARSEERAAREQQSADDLRAALDQTEQPQQPAQQDQQTPELEQPQAEQLDPEAAHAQLQAAEAELAEVLKSPVVREALERDHAVVRQQAASEVERAHALASAAQQHYATATQNLLNEASGVIGALYPELNGLSGAELNGALRVMAQQNPQRVQQLQHLASRAQGLVEAQARQQHEAAQGQALQRDAALEQYTSANVKEYENWTARENPETLKSIRENLKPTVEKYGVPFETLMAIHTGKMQMGATEFVRSAAFQKMLHDSIKWNLAQRGITNARSNAVAKVIRPGVSESGPRVHEGDLSAAASRFNLPGGNEGTQGLKNAAAWITAKRGARG
jgi:hypothetical protein